MQAPVRQCFHRLPNTPDAFKITVGDAGMAIPSSPKAPILMILLGSIPKLFTSSVKNKAKRSTQEANGKKCIPVKAERGFPHRRSTVIHYLFEQPTLDNVNKQSSPLLSHRQYSQLQKKRYGAVL